MKRYILEFVQRGFTACGFGPLVLVVIYLAQQHFGAVTTLTVRQVCLGTLSLSALSFLAGGMNILYQIERIPLTVAILIHGVILYVSYLGVYLINGWLEQGVTPILVFSVIFLLGYLAIWAAIYCISKNNTKKLNQKLMKKQQSAEGK